jgi:hypothetical protein
MANPQISTKYSTTLSQNNPKSRLFKMIFYFVQIELEHYMLYMHVKKVCICRLLEVLSSQQMLATANRLQIC